MNLPRLLDPDTKPFSRDKLQHFAKGYITCFLLMMKLGPYESVALSAVMAGVYEAGQTDTALALGQLGKPGFGFGILDIFAETVGAVAAVVTIALLRTLL